MAERLFTIAILLLCLTLILLGLFYFEYPWKLLRFPFGIGLIIVVLCIVDLVLGKRSGTVEAALESTPDEQWERSLSPREALRGSLWVLGALPTVYLLGYVIGLPLYILAAVKLRGHGWVTSLATSAGGLAVVYFGFVVGLGVPLPLFPFDL